MSALLGVLSAGPAEALVATSRLWAGHSKCTQWNTCMCGREFVRVFSWSLDFRRVLEVLGGSVERIPPRKKKDRMERFARLCRGVGKDVGG